MYVWLNIFIAAVPLANCVNFLSSPVSAPQYLGRFIDMFYLRLFIFCRDESSLSNDNK